MKNKNSIFLIIILGVISFSTYIFFNGIQVGEFKIQNARDSINLGLDLAGGVYVVLEADTDASGEELNRMMNQTRAIISQRVDGLGVSEPNIAIEGDKRIRVELAGVENPQEAIDLIGRTAQLQFVDPKGKIVITGQNIVSAEVAFDEDNFGARQPVVSLEFDREGRMNFASITGELINNQNIDDRIIYIILDEEIISSPAVSYIEDGGKAITDGKAIISGGFDIEGANNLATLIRAGALPVDLVEHRTSIIGPTLGLEAFEKSILAGSIALLLIFTFMTFMYKLLGLVSILTLISYTIIVIAIMSILGVNLTLPGIAGLILSIGMAVDANVLIFERIREEILEGKTIRTAVDAGFKRGMTTVIDSNITTFIAGIVLYYFGIGPIKGFGVTLIIGILASMLTSVLLSKIILGRIVSIKNIKNKKIFGV